MLLVPIALLTAPHPQIDRKADGRKKKNFTVIKHVGQLISRAVALQSHLLRWYGLEDGSGNNLLNVELDINQH